LGVVLPSILVVTIISLFLEAFKSNLYINRFLKGISAGVGVLVFLAFFRIAKKIKINIFNGLLFVLGVVVSFFNLISVIYVLIGVAFIGILVGILKEKRRKLDDS
ncbi:MAG: chromate transporter, partial [Acholeplasmatales bacterium]|nr:chromate transporter [Acholeplasmatales bacterium]